MQKYQLKNNIEVAVFRLKDQKSGDSKKFFKGLHYHYEIMDPGSLEFELKVNNSEYKITLYSYIVRIGDNILVYSPKEFEKYFEPIEEKEKDKKKKLTCYHEPMSVDKIPVPNMKGFYYCPICGNVSYNENEKEK